MSSIYIDRILSDESCPEASCTLIVKLGRGRSVTTQSWSKELSRAGERAKLEAETQKFSRDARMNFEQIEVRLVPIIFNETLTLACIRLSSEFMCLLRRRSRLSVPSLWLS